MALQIHTLSSSSLTHTNKHHHHHLLLYTPPLLSPIKTNFTLKFQKPTDTDTDSSIEPPVPQKKPTSPGLGFGSKTPFSSSISGPSKSDKKQKSDRREKGSIIRRSPIEKPVFLSEEEESKATEVTKNESAFLLAWLCLGGIILVQGLLLASSGFLPEQWDRFFVKYLYPSFTPTVGLFIAGTVAYGVLKYLQNEKLKDQK